MGKPEQWLPVVGYEGLYEVSSLGRAKSLHSNKLNRKICILKPHKNKRGYYTVSLCDKGDKRLVFIHRLVATAFIPNPKKKSQVNHKNGDKANNSVNNLEWATPKENTLHHYRVLGHKSHGGVQRKAVKCLETGEIFPSVADAARAVGASDSNIIKCAKKNSRLKACFGLHWEYV